MVTLERLNCILGFISKKENWELHLNSEGDCVIKTSTGFGVTESVEGKLNSVCLKLREPSFGDFEGSYGFGDYVYGEDGIGYRYIKGLWLVWAENARVIGTWKDKFRLESGELIDREGVELEGVKYKGYRVRRFTDKGIELYRRDENGKSVEAEIRQKFEVISENGFGLEVREC